jgi:hypothetical protein
MSTLRLVSLPSELLNNWINNDNRAVIGSIVTDSDGSLIINDSSGQTYKTFKIPDSSLRDPSKYSLMISRAESPSKVSTTISGGLENYSTIQHKKNLPCKGRSRAAIGCALNLHKRHPMLTHPPMQSVFVSPNQNR